MNTQTLAQQGQTTTYTTMAEAVSHRIQDLRKDVLRNLFSDFSDGLNRLVSIASIRGVEYIDDSLAENINATWFALESMYKPVVWIIEGEDNKKIESLLPWVEKKVRVIIHVGEGVLVRDSFMGNVGRYLQVRTLEEAVHSAYLCAEEGQAVLYAPLFAGKEEWESSIYRSQRFRRAVNEL